MTGQILERLEARTTPDSAWVLELIKRGAVSGVEGGCHGWLYKAARGLYLYRRRNGLTKEDIFSLLRAKADGYVRHVSDSEIENTIESAIRHAEDPDHKSGTTARPKWPIPNFQRVDEIVIAGFGLRELLAANPGSPVTSNHVVSCLFPGDPLICAGEDEIGCVTKPLSNWLNGEAWLNEGLSQQAFIVPSRMTGLRGRNQEGELSNRSLDNTGPREYLVIECDISKFAGKSKTPTPWKPWIEKWEVAGLSVADASAAILWHLNRYALLALAVHSGGKSIHGWFPCRGVDEEKLKRFMEYSVMLGADPATWNRCQLVRMPGGTRDNGKRQKVLYWNPEGVRNSKREQL